MHSKLLGANLNPNFTTIGEENGARDPIQNENTRVEMRASERGKVGGGEIENGMMDMRKRDI